MAAKEAPKTVRLVDSRGVTVSVAAEKADARLAAGYTKAGARKSSSSSDK